MCIRDRKGRAVSASPALPAARSRSAELDDQSQPTDHPRGPAVRIPPNLGLRARLHLPALAGRRGGAGANGLSVARPLHADPNERRRRGFRLDRPRSGHDRWCGRLRPRVRGSRIRGRGRRLWHAGLAGVCRRPGRRAAQARFGFRPDLPGPGRPGAAGGRAPLRSRRGLSATTSRRTCRTWPPRWRASRPARPGSTAPSSTPPLL